MGGVCSHVLVFSLSVGKTSLLHRYVHKTFYEDYQTTLGASILSKIIILDDTTLKLQVSNPPIPSSTTCLKVTPQFPDRCSHSNVHPEIEWSIGQQTSTRGPNLVLHLLLKIKF